MTPYKVLTTHQSGNDIRGIDDYISTELLMPASASKIVKEIKKRIQSLKFIPERGARYPNEPWFSRNVRTTHVKNYLIIYRVDKRRRKVTILNVVYSRRDIDAVLKQTKA